MIFAPVLFVLKPAEAQVMGHAHERVLPAKQNRGVEKMEKWKVLRLKATKGLGNANNVGYKLIIDAPTEEEAKEAAETLKMLFDRLERNIDGYFEAIPLGGGVFAKWQELKTPGTFWVWVTDYDDPIDATEEDLEKLIELLQEEYEKITKPETHYFEIKPFQPQNEPEDNINMGE